MAVDFDKLNRETRNFNNRNVDRFNPSNPRNVYSQQKESSYNNQTYKANMEITEMVTYLKRLVDDFYGQGKHFEFTARDANIILDAALKLEVMNNVTQRQTSL